MKKSQNIIVRILLLTIAAACIIIGITQGEPDVVLRKAIRVCLECIGIG